MHRVIECVTFVSYSFLVNGQLTMPMIFTCASVDDSIIFTRASVDEAATVSNILRRYEYMSG